MADVLKNILIGTIVACLFVFLIVGFAINIGGDYGKDVDDLTDNKINFTGIEEKLNSAKAQSDDWREDFEKQKVMSLVAGLVFGGIFKIAITMWGFITTPFTLLADVLTNVLHVPEIVVSVLVFAFVVTIMFGIWRLLKQGD